MDMTITALMAATVAVCLQGKVVFGVLLEASDPASRSNWGANDVLLICTDGDFKVTNAIFARNGIPITSDGDVYRTEEQGSQLSFVASSTTEGKFTCKNNVNVTSNEIAIIGKRVLWLFNLVMYTYTIIQ